MEVQNASGSYPLSAMQNFHGTITVIKKDGTRTLFDEHKMHATLAQAVRGFEHIVDLSILVAEVWRTIYDGITTSELEKAYVLAACAFIERDPAYSFIAARLLLEKLMKEVCDTSFQEAHWQDAYRQSLRSMILQGIGHGYYDPRLAEFDLDRLSQALVLDRDNLFGYTGLFTLYERYFLKHNGQRLELPQVFWMRIAMGLALEESQKNERALEFYELLSRMLYMPSTPTLFHAGFPRAQLSSCYLNVVHDDLHHIFKTLGDNAQLSKWAGGIGTDWTNVRATGAYIKTIKATSQGVVPYLKIANDIVVAITRSGIRRGGTCVYLEVWHLDFEDFLDLKRNTGDERRRTHDMNTAAWVPDLFMKRMLNNETWTFFSPDEVPDLHELYGKAFEEKYLYYEQQAYQGKIKLFKQIPAQQLWRKMLTRLFETGHPWITFKDPCNIRSPQDHVGVVHSSNLCTEITLNTSSDETAVCNLGSINLGAHIQNGALDQAQLAQTIRSAVRMLDNVIDLNFYPTIEARNSNLRHRPIGLGLMGFQDALYKLKINFMSEEAIEFSDSSMEFISYHALKASHELAKERGAYPTYKGSKWDRGIFPLDSLALLEQERGRPILTSRTTRLDWDGLKSDICTQGGLRNSNLMAIAPTATISTIVGCYPCIEPIFKNMYVKSNVSGEFTVINYFLVEDLKQLNLWDQRMVDELKYYDGDISHIARIPDYIKERYKTAFEIDLLQQIKVNAVRCKWVDQSISFNLFMANTQDNKMSGRRMDDGYCAAWDYGFKSTYYFRTLGATQVEKSTLSTDYGFTQKRQYDGKACSITNPECESCQ